MEGAGKGGPGPCQMAVSHPAGVVARVSCRGCRAVACYRHEVRDEAAVEGEAERCDASWWLCSMAAAGPPR